MDPQKSGPNGIFVTTLSSLSSSFLSWLAMLCRDILLYLFMELCRDKVLLNVPCNYLDMSVLYRDISLMPCIFNTQMVCRYIKTLLRQSFLLVVLDCVSR